MWPRFPAAEGLQVDCFLLLRRHRGTLATRYEALSSPPRLRSSPDSVDHDRLSTMPQLRKVRRISEPHMRRDRVRAAFVYANPRADLVEKVTAGLAPDTVLLGQNHMLDLGIDAVVQDPPLSGHTMKGAAHRLVWHLRELVLPLELRGVDAVCTPLANFLPLTLRLRGLHAVVVNYGLNLILRRSSPLRRRLMRSSLASATRVVCLGASQTRELVELTGLPDNHIETAHFGVDERFFTASPTPDDGYVLSVGRDLARDYRTLAAAAEGLDARVVLVTEHRNLTSVQLPANVEVRHGLSYPDLRSLYEGAACVVIPMRRDGYPYGSEASGLTAYLEAAACGRAVVASERAILEDYLEPGRTGLTASPEDPSALRDEIERVLRDRELAAQLSAGARQAVEERFTTKHLAERLAPLIREAGEPDDGPPGGEAGGDIRKSARGLPRTRGT
jgi:glycosyltransferase involved in cell wall biosynthesis